MGCALSLFSLNYTTVQSCPERDQAENKESLPGLHGKHLGAKHGGEP